MFLCRFQNLLRAVETLSFNQGNNPGFQPTRNPHHYWMGRILTKNCTPAKKLCMENVANSMIFNLRYSYQQTIRSIDKKIIAISPEDVFLRHPE